MKYYEIDENMARLAHEMMSMRDYPENQATNEYRSTVDAAAALVEQQKKRLAPITTINWMRCLTPTPASWQHGQMTITETAQAVRP